MAVSSMFDLRFKPDSLGTAFTVIDETLVATRAFPGCLGVTVLVDTADPAHVVLYEAWESLEHDQAYRVWRASDDPAAASGLGALLAIAPVLTVFTVADGG